MLGKTLLTLAVLAIAILVLKQRKASQSAATGTPGGEAGVARQPAADEGSDVRLAAYLFLILMFGAAAIIYYWRWQDDHTVLTISLFRDGQSEPATYEVYKADLQSRSFITLEGVRITVADNERMEVTGLED